MRINENLIIDSAFKKSPGYWGTYKNYRKNGSVVTAIYSQPTALGIILESSEDLKPNTNYILSVYVKGTSAFSMNYNYFMYGEEGNSSLGYSGETLSPNVWHIVSVPFRHNKSYNFRNIMIGHNYTEVGDMELSFKYPKLEIWEVATPYVLNKNDLEPIKQAVFVAGGYSKRCIQSRFSGGGVC